MNQKLLKQLVRFGRPENTSLKRGVNETDLVNVAPSDNTTLGHYQRLAPIYDSRLTIYYPYMNSDPAIRITMLPRDTNSQGTIFGGVILSYIDMAGAIEAHRHTGMDRFVTVAMREVIFHAPVLVGDLVSFYSETLKIGKTSITVRVIVEAERYGSGDRKRVTEAEVVYVAVDVKGKKTEISVKTS